MHKWDQFKNCIVGIYMWSLSVISSGLVWLKVTTGITALWQPSVHSDIVFWSFDVGSSYYCDTLMIPFSQYKAVISPLPWNMLWMNACTFKSDLDIHDSNSCQYNVLITYIHNCCSVIGTYTYWADWSLLGNKSTLTLWPLSCNTKITTRTDYLYYLCNVYPHNAIDYGKAIHHVR